MADVTIKRGDTRPKLVRTLQQTVGVTTTAIDLTTATSVKLNLKDTQTSTTGGGLCSITSAAAGQVTYTWLTSDTSTARTWNAEFEITWNDAGIETVPNGSYFTIEVFGDLG